MAAHVDDFMCTGGKEETKWSEEHLRKTFEFTVTTFGGCPGESQQVAFLNRENRCPQGCEIEGDEKHVEILQRQRGLSESSGVETPLARGESSRQEEGSQEREEMSEAEATPYRMGAARISFFISGQNRPCVCR